MNALKESAGGTGGSSSSVRKENTSRRKKSKKNQQLTFNAIVRKARDNIKKKTNDLNNDLDKTVCSTLAVVNKFSRGVNGKKKNITKIPRVIPIPKSGGVLPLIPILAGISAVGGAASGVSSIVKAISDIVSAKRNLFPAGEKKQIGNGLYLAPYKKNGYGLYLAPPPFYLERNSFSKN